MKKFKLDKQSSKRFVAISLATLMLVTSMVGCSKKQNTKNEVETTIVNELDPYESEKSIVKELINNLKKEFPELEEETINNTSLIMLLDILAREDENGKISADVISNFKSIIDSDKMMSDFNSLIDIMENKAITQEKLIVMSNILSKELSADVKILSNIEEITKKIMNTNDKEEILKEFNKIYTLFVDEDEINMNGIKFEVRDLNYANRAMAGSYARIAAYYAKDYISEEQYSSIDKRTNDQNNKAYIKTKLEILSNQMTEKSEIDVIKIFNNKYVSFENLLENKINASNDVIEDLIDYVNLDYISSDKVSTKDKRTVLSDYDDQKVNDAITLIEAIHTYNIKNQDEAILNSNLLINVEDNETNKLALDFIQFNTINLLSTVNDKSNFNDVYNNPYFQNIYKYFTKQNFTHKYIENDQVVEKTIVWQEISNGVNFINNTIIINTLNKLSNVKGIKNFIEMAQENLSESVQYIQNRVTGECKKVDAKEFVK